MYGLELPSQHFTVMKATSLPGAPGVIAYYMGGVRRARL